MNTTTEITRNTNSIFDTKEQYLAFRAKWKQLHADGFHKRQPVPIINYTTQRGENNAKGNPTWISKEEVIGYHKVSPLTAWHHLIFNLAIGRNPPVKAFGDRSERKEKHSWNKPPLYYQIRYGSKSFDVFGDSLTAEQRAELIKAVDDFVCKL
jgi:hypothetical protein